MKLKLTSACLLVCALAACEPSQRCSGELYFDAESFSCAECPDNAHFESGACVCNDGNYEFAGKRCVLKDGAMAEPMDGDEDSGTPEDSGAGYAGNAGPSCDDYCGFMKGCLGDNALAAAALSDIVSDLHADDPEACRTSCMSDTGGDGTDSAVVACIEAGRAPAMCDGDSSQAGLEAAFTLLGDCCGNAKGDALCKSICEPLKASPLTASMVTFCD